MKNVRQLSWFSDSLINMRKSLESERAVLRAQMHRVVSLEQDVTCLQNLLTDATSKGYQTMDADWREKQFKGRR